MKDTPAYLVEHLLHKVQTEEEGAGVLTRMLETPPPFSLLARGILYGDVEALREAVPRLREISFEPWALAIWHLAARVNEPERIDLLNELATTALQAGLQLWAALAYRRLYDLTPHLGKRALAVEVLSQLRDPLPRFFLLAATLSAEPEIEKAAREALQLLSRLPPPWALPRTLDQLCHYDASARTILWLTARLGVVRDLSDLLRDIARWDLSARHPHAPFYEVAIRYAERALSLATAIHDPIASIGAAQLLAGSAFRYAVVLGPRATLDVVEEALARAQRVYDTPTGVLEPGGRGLLLAAISMLSLLKDSVSTDWHTIPQMILDDIGQLLSSVAGLHGIAGIEFERAWWRHNAGWFTRRYAHLIPSMIKRIEVLERALILLHRAVEEFEALGDTLGLTYAIREFVHTSADLAELLSDEDQVTHLLEEAGRYASFWRDLELRYTTTRLTELLIGEARTRLRFLLTLLWQDPQALAGVFEEWASLFHRSEGAAVRAVRASFALNAARTAATCALLTREEDWSWQAYEYAQLAYRLWSAAGVYRKAAYASLLTTIPALLHGDRLHIDPHHQLQRASAEFLIGFRGNRNWPYSEVLTVLEICSQLSRTKDPLRLRRMALQLSECRIVSWPEAVAFLRALSAYSEDPGAAEPLLSQVFAESPAADRYFPYTCAQQAAALLRNEVRLEEVRILPPYRALSPLIEHGQR